MKKSLLLVLAALAAGFAGAQTKRCDLSDSFTFYYDLESEYKIYPDKIVYDYWIGKTELPRTNLFLADDGFYYFIDEDNRKLLVVFDGKWMVYYSNPDVDYSSRGYSSYELYVFENNNFYMLQKYGTVYEVSSVLTENRTVYSGDNLGTAFLPPDCKEDTSHWIYGHKPWVEGVSGNGIGQTITISTEKKFLNLEVINGYVDLERTDLYKKNSRVRVFTVEDLDNGISFDFEFADEVRIQTIGFEKPTDHVRLTIKEVYPGTKWQDTCVTSIIPKN